ncbi:MAG: GatB/YqeY domain-containing protein [Rikenellaceae bacterium]|nr:GatB/YqeY domain-containing protein [Rikenellaceae bacterium]
MELEKKISQGIMQAMKDGDPVRRDTLRNVKKQIIEAKTAGPAMDILPDDAVVRIISKLAKQGADSAEVFQQQGRDDLYEYEMAQVAVLKEYLPEQLEGTALEEEVARIIADTGASGMQDMGKVMGAASKRLAGRADGKAISEVVRRLLS